MKKLLLLFYFIPFFGSGQQLQNQAEDVFILQKNGANIKTFAAGMYFSMETIYDQAFEGTITAVRNDSVFLNGIPFHYKEIRAIRWERTKLNYTADGVVLMIAGGGVLLLGAVNGLYRGDKSRDWYKPASFVTAGALLATGFLLLKSRYKKYTLGKKYTIHYLELASNNKNNPRPF